VNVVLCFIAAIEANDLKDEEDVLKAIDSKWHICDSSDCVHRIAIVVQYNYIYII
jgi:hypothetical protein